MNICVYAASGRELAAEYYECAERLGRLMAQQGHCLVYGGGSEGLMGACARGAHSEGGRITGIAPRFFDKPGILYTDCDEFIYTETMRQRKQLMEEKADAFIVLPGGIGTYEEFFEILTLKQLGRHSKPIALVNLRGYYEPVRLLLEHTAGEKFMNESCLKLCSFCPNEVEALAHCVSNRQICGSIDRYIK